MTDMKYDAAQIEEITRIVKDGFKYAGSITPNGRMVFAWLVCTYILLEFTQRGIVKPDVMREYHQLTSYYGQLENRREVKK